MKALNKRLQTNDTVSNDDSSEWPDIDDDDNDSMLDKTTTVSDVSNGDVQSTQSSQSDIVKIEIEDSSQTPPTPSAVHTV